MGFDRKTWMEASLMLAALLIALLGALVNVAAWAAPAPAAPAASPSAASQEGADAVDPQQLQALQRAHRAVVGVQAMAVADASSAATLGRVRAGSGVVISDDGLVLTIGYLILEADQVQLVLDDERRVPARVVAYDVATGFGLLQALAPLKVAPVPLGSAGALQVEEPLMMASGPGGLRSDGGAIVGIAQLVSRRAFAGYWEYLIDGALFTAPARADHSGAGLFNSRGELVGIGSLVVAQALGDEAPSMPGNMFVPIDLLTPILPELRRAGMSAASKRAWLGLNCVELGGELRVARVSTDSPADVAGLQPGDRILRIDGASVKTLAALWQSLWQGGQPERDVQLDIVREGEAQRVTLHSVDRMKTLRRAQGI
ncbi:S1C family serine protease [Aquincola tertiaricarbonis]|uniref:S1C family serine protease n=1 Tax=Aquincola tertiaricarbonis TaxID=391953 RepID=A0ABY4SE87_AQUTE|nr:S1C family serine protease [Aquincola tertiaricarbonis]URI10794.1 S1C family serine protease [Aquincola tertiaricarbonis]